MIRVFIIDEHSVVRDGLRSRLTRAADMCVVGDAACATAVCATDAPDVFLLDQNVRTLGAPDIRSALAMLSSAPVLMMGWQVSPASLKLALGAGARGFVMKNGPAELLVQATRTVQAGGTWLDPAACEGVFCEVTPGTDLTRREREVFRLVGLGQPSKLIAKELQLSVRTVESHRQSIKRKLQLNDHASLIRFAVQRAEMEAF